MPTNKEYAEFRKKLLKKMTDELFGPEHTDDESRQQELLDASPLQLYSTGVLFPQKSVNSQLEDDASKVNAEVSDEDFSFADSSEAKVKLGSKVTSDATVLEEQPLNLANEFNPPAAGITVKVTSNTQLVVEITAGRYTTEKVEEIHPKAGQEKADGSLHPETRIKEKFRRFPIFDPVAIDIGSSTVTNIPPICVQNTDGKLKLHVRTQAAADEKINVSLALVNHNKGSVDAPPRFDAAFFQVGISAKEASGAPVFHPIDRAGGVSAGEEMEILDMLYRDKRSFALGHGCSASWLADCDDENIATHVQSEFLPKYDLKPVKAREEAFSTSQFNLSMRALSGTEPHDNFLTDSLTLLANDYERWIVSCESRKNDLGKDYQNSASINLKRCWKCLERIKEGIAYLSSNADAMMAFKLANRAMLIQQVRTRFQGDIDPDTVYSDMPSDYCVPGKEEPKWRPFQLAFVLMNITCCALDEHPDRDVCDLIWFPTGGGKTEAYLGLAAFCICLRRLNFSEDRGVSVLMRYTLRLLTAQQFQRAAALIVALESLRIDNYLGVNLGNEPISIGLWVGMGLSPNRRKDAINRLNQLTTNFGAKNPFQLLRCPWCRSSLAKREKLGYQKELFSINSEDTVIFRCANSGCRWNDVSNRLPVVVIDEDIYESPPTLLLGTVDKFAQLSWVPDTGRLFGADGFSNPPSLIIQDELHLISGPLGTIVGLYETIIDNLCTREGKKPKIVASTATIRESAKQCIGLYARERFEFPPQGLDAGDSYFAYEDKESDGRLYVGVFGTAVKSHATAQVRVISPLLQAVMPEPPETQPSDVADGYATLLWYFNSLRELGHAVTLSTGDIPEHQFNLCARQKIKKDTRRIIRVTQELTSRRTAEEIPKILEELNRTWPPVDNQAWPVDILLATNMISVGVDVSRLGLMVVAGQPKSTAEYIQATSRVGRNFPGLVVTVYNPARSRDRSHYEQFIGYHQAIYRYVEPTSVTPFSAPARTRGFAGMVIAMARLMLGICTPPEIGDYSDELRLVMEAILKRVQLVDEDEFEDSKEELNSIVEKWKSYSPPSFGKMAGTPSTQTLMYPMGRMKNEDFEAEAFPILTSMRNVDATCAARVLTTYPDTEIES